MILAFHPPGFVCVRVGPRYTCTIKILKIGTRKIITIIDLKIEQFVFSVRRMFLEDAAKMVNSAGPNQTAPSEQSDLGLHYLLKPSLSQYLEFLG